MSAIDEYLEKFDNTPWFPGREPPFEERLAMEIRMLLRVHEDTSRELAKVSSTLGWIQNPDRMGQ